VSLLDGAIRSFDGSQWEVEKPVEVNRYSAKRFLWALFNLGTKGKPFSPEYLARDFGSEAELAQDGIRALYEAILTTDSPKAQTFFNQWKVLFGEVCGYDVNKPSVKIQHLADSYGVPADSVRPAELLFSLHTYYALFMKLLASESMKKGMAKLWGWVLVQMAGTELVTVVLLE
jgi:hypothetical protein